jgi:hypothetical protein
MQPFTLAGFLILLVVPLFAASCRPAGEDGPVAPPDVRAPIVMVGLWGGDQIELNVAEEGATVEFSCAHGTIEGSIVPDEAGRFAVDGLYFQEHGGPVSDKDETLPVKARYEGQVAGLNMSLAVVNLETQEKIGAYSLAFGAAAKITKCL